MKESISTSAPICKNHHTDTAIAGQLEDPLSQPQLSWYSSFKTLARFCAKILAEVSLLAHQEFQDEGHWTSYFNRETIKVCQAHFVGLTKKPNGGLSSESFFYCQPWSSIISITSPLNYKTLQVGPITGGTIQVFGI